MKFLVYTAEPSNQNATLEGFEPGKEIEITRMIPPLEEMGLDRVLENQSVNLLVDNVRYNETTGIVIADIYKQTSPGKALHQLSEDGDEMTVQQIISENDDAFVQGILGSKVVDDEIQLLIENDFGSYFTHACNNIDVKPQYSGETVQAIRDSKTIGDTTIEFADDIDLEAALMKPPADEDVREELGFGNTNYINRLASLLSISKSHSISLDIDRELWLENVEIFDDLIDSGIVKRVRVTGTKNNRVKLGKGGDRAIRRTIETNSEEEASVEEAFGKISE